MRDGSGATKNTEEPALWEELGRQGSPHESHHRIGRSPAHAVVEMEELALDVGKNGPHAHVCERFTRTMLACSARDTTNDETDMHDNGDAYAALLEEEEISGHETLLDTHTLQDDVSNLGAGGDTASNRSAGWTGLCGGEDMPSPKDLDSFFLKIYEYYREHGAACVIVSRLMDLVTLGFTIMFSTFLFIFVKWRKLLECDSEATCLPLHAYISYEALSQHGLWEVLVWIYFCTLTLFWCWNFALFFPTCRDAIAMSRFYLRRLGITTRQLETMEWHQVVARVRRLQRSERFKIQINKPDLDAHDIASRIMRKENYLIGMFNRDVLDLRIPFICSICQVDSFFLTKHLEWNLRFCILDHIFNRNFSVREEFVRDAGALRRRFRMMAALNLLLLPFILVFMVVHFFLKNAEELHANRDYLGPREWAPMALWKFREFNELPHVFAQRINKSHTPANKYVKQFQVPLLIIVARGVSFVLGALLALLLLFSLLDDSVPLHVEIFDRNLLWWIAILSGALALSRSLVPKRSEDIFEPEAHMRDVAALTHYMPPTWIRRCRAHEVRDCFLELYPYKLALLASEVASVLVVPLILCFSLPACAEDIVAFVRDFTTHVDGIGHVCTYSRFDVRQFGHPGYVGDVREGNSNSNSNSNSPAAGRVEGRPPLPSVGMHLGIDESHDASQSVCSNNGKMEKSFLNFKTQHPHWEPSAASGGVQLLQQLSLFRMAAMNQAADAAHLQRSQTAASPALSRTTGCAPGSGNGSDSGADAGASVSVNMLLSASAHSALSCRLAEAPQPRPSGSSAATNDNCFSWLDRYFEHRIESARSDDVPPIASSSYGNR